MTIDRRYCGPPDSGNGGYVCGVFASSIDGPAEVTLRLPPPLDVPLTIERAEGQIRFEHSGALVGEAAPGSAPDWEPPAPVPFDVAAAASQRSWIVEHPEAHPFRTCFVCGPDRVEGDGLRVFVGPVPDRDVAAATWIPHGTLPVEGDRIAPEIVWAVLDCAGGIGLWYARGDFERLDPHVLGRFAVEILELPRPGDRCVVLGWRISREGRKVLAGSALQGEDGRLLARGHATWIALRSPSD